MRVPVGTSHAAEASATVRGKYRCNHCGFEADVRASGQSRGTAFNPLFLDGEGASARAREEAGDFAESDARENVRLMPCPRCGERQPGVALRFWGFWVFVAALPLALGVPLAGGFSWLVYGGGWAIAVSATMLLGSALIVRAARNKWAHADEHVQLVDSSQHPVPGTCD